MRRLFLAFFGAGYLRPAPGTWGSLAAIPVGLAIHIIAGPGMLILAIAILFSLGVTLARRELDGADDHDPSWIVIDEVVGQWIALLPVSLGAYLTGSDVLKLWPGIIAGFALFRLFDIWKPWLAGRADRRGDAMGLMLDDVWAGIFAAVVVIALAALAHVGFVSGVPDQL